MSAVPFFDGWVGFGSSLGQLMLAEPTDPSYARRAILFAALVGADIDDVSSGSIGPATQLWQLAYAGFFDASSEGNLLACVRLLRPLTVAPGATLTQSQAFSFRLLAGAATDPTGGFAFLGGTQLGRTSDGRVVTACSNLVVSGGMMSVIGTPQTSLASLPTVAPPAGSGEPWNNGGVICVA